MIVPFGILFAFGSHSDKEVNADCLEILLETLIDLNLVYLRSARSKGLTVPFLYEAGVVYGRTRSWDTIPDLYAKGVGDCKSLSAAFIAFVRFNGHEAKASFRFNPREKDGGLDFHILVMTDGRLAFNGRRIETNHDPSKVLGMPTND